MLGIERNAIAGGLEPRTALRDRQFVNGALPELAVHTQLKPVFEKRLKHEQHRVCAGRVRCFGLDAEECGVSPGWAACNLRGPGLPGHADQDPQRYVIQIEAPGRSPDPAFAALACLN